MKTASSVYITNQKTADNTSGASQPNVLQASSSEPVVSEWVTLDKEFTAKEKLEIVLSAPVQGEAGGRGCGGNSARRAQSVRFGYFQTDTARKISVRTGDLLSLAGSNPTLSARKISAGPKPSLSMYSSHRSFL